MRGNIACPTTIKIHMYTIAFIINAQIVLHISTPIASGEYPLPGLIQLYCNLSLFTFDLEIERSKGKRDDITE